MLPISQERVQFIKERLNVLDQMRRALMRRKDFYYQKLNASGEVQSSALAQIRTEELLLYVEHDVLAEHFGKIALASFEAAGVTLPPPFPAPERILG